LIFDLGQEMNFKVFSFILPEEDNVLPELIGTANEDGLGLSIWWKETTE